MAFRFLLVCLVLCSCTPNRMIQTDLFFGQSKPDGGMVTEVEWKSFYQKQVAGVFKEGSTTFHGTGSWYDPVSKQLITEPAYVVTYFYKPSRNMSRQIDSLRQWYKTTFQQQSVLRVDKKVNVRW